MTETTESPRQPSPSPPPAGPSSHFGRLRLFWERLSIARQIAIAYTLALVVAIGGAGLTVTIAWERESAIASYHAEQHRLERLETSLLSAEVLRQRHLASDLGANRQLMSALNDVRQHCSQLGSFCQGSAIARYCQEASSQTGNPEAALEAARAELATVRRELNASEQVLERQGFPWRWLAGSSLLAGAIALALGRISQRAIATPLTAIAALNAALSEKETGKLDTPQQIALLSEWLPARLAALQASAKEYRALLVSLATTLGEGDASQIPSASELDTPQQLAILGEWLQAQLAALQVSAKQYRTLLSGLPDLLLQMNVDGSEMQALCTGNVRVFKPQQLAAGASLHEIMPPARARQRLEYARQAIDANSIRTYEYQLPVDGEIRDEQARIIPCDRDKVLILVRDVTDLRRAESARQRCETQLRQIAIALPDLLVFRLSRDGVYIDYMPSDRVPDLAGSDCLGKHVSEVLPPELASKHLNALKRALETGQVQLYEQQLDIGGEWRYEEVRVVAGGEDEVWFFVRDVTDRERLVSDLAQSEERFRKLAETLDGIFYIATPDLARLLYVGPNYERVFGRSLAQMRSDNHSWLDAVHPDDRERLGRAIADFDQESWLQEYRIVRPDGGVRWILDRAFAIRGERGETLRLMGLFEDASERKRQHEALQLIVEGTASATGEEFFRSLVRCLAEVLQVRYAVVTQWVDGSCDRVETLAFWHGDRFGSRFEYSLHGTPCSQAFQRQLCLYPSSVREHFPEDEDLATLGVESYAGIRLEDSIGRPLGHLAVMDANPMSDFSLLESILRIFGARAGVELERQRVENALRKRSQRERAAFYIIEKMCQTLSVEEIFRAATEELPYNFRCDRVIICCLNRGGSGGFCTTSAGGLGGAVSEEWLLEMMQNESQLRAGQSLQCCRLEAPESTLLGCPIGSGEDFAGVLWLFRAAGETFDDLEVRLLQHVADRCAIAMHQASLYRQAESQVRELEHLNQLKDDFLSTVSHELRSPLTNIYVAIKMLRMASSAEKQQTYLDLLEMECLREKELVDDLLDLQRLEAERYQVSRERIELSDWLPQFAQPYSMRAREQGLNLEIAIAEELPLLNTDRDSLKRILQELLNNACKYTNEGGNIRLDVRARAERTGSPLGIEIVVGNAAEIEREDLGRIFEKFYRGRSRKRQSEGGTGLGLALIRQLAILLGGEITVESASGWTTFRVWLPAETDGDRH